MQSELMADVIRRTILERGLSVRDVETMSGVDYGRIHRFMNKKRDLTLATADKIVAALDLVLVPRQDVTKK
jgi:plasmid maintenance system antidote protein VapI